MANANAHDDWGDIGQGSKGKIFEHPGTAMCYKLPKPGCNRLLYNNYEMQQKVVEAFARYASKHPNTVDCQIPRTVWFADPKDEDFWKEAFDKIEWAAERRKLGKFTEDDMYAFCMERVFPVPEKFRELLMDRYWPSHLKAAGLANKDNNDCLIKVLLGAKEQPDDRPKNRIKLRNFAMFADNFRTLGLPAGEYAEAMGLAMAVLHWEAHIDGADIEFVLGSSPQDGNKARYVPTADDIEKLPKLASTRDLALGRKKQPDCVLRKISLWILDFDECAVMEPTEAGVDQAVTAFKKNAKYCPRPGGDEFEEKLWKIFKAKYENVSRELLPSGSKLAELYLAKITKESIAMREAQVLKPGPSDQDEDASVSSHILPNR